MLKINFLCVQNFEEQYLKLICFVIQTFIRPRNRYGCAMCRFEAEKRTLEQLQYEIISPFDVSIAHLLITFGVDRARARASLLPLHVHLGR
jgi:hypothetical protein